MSEPHGQGPWCESCGISSIEIVNGKCKACSELDAANAEIARLKRELDEAKGEVARYWVALISTYMDKAGIVRASL